MSMMIVVSVEVVKAFYEARGFRIHAPHVTFEAETNQLSAAVPHNLSDVVLNILVMCERQQLS